MRKVRFTKAGRFTCTTKMLYANKAPKIWYYQRKTVILWQLKQADMTNHDFWMSISDIINEGFTSEGLAKLDDYAEQLSTGKILYKRFSPSEQYGCREGGRIHVIASLLAGAEVGTDQLSAPEGSFKNISELRIGGTRKLINKVEIQLE